LSEAGRMNEMLNKLTQDLSLGLEAKSSKMPSSNQYKHREGEIDSMSSR
jgi:hypothetical protein